MNPTKRNWLALCLLFTLGCQQKMGRQPSYRPLEPSAFFPDQRSARPLVSGTLARGQLRANRLLFTGRQSSDKAAILPVTLLGSSSGGPLIFSGIFPPLMEKMAVTDYATHFPFPVTSEVLDRGQQRFTIFCAVCHDATGNGNGKIVQRGYTHPPSYITDYSRGFQRRGFKMLLRDVPVGYYFEVVSKGYGAMPDYASQVPPRDRWAIIAYIRALQLSQHARLGDLPEKERRAAQKALEGKP
ncbi:MAG TPA: cytochrome c [Gemmataceae bacterium]|nr:cytochrome c [Gemmataceae bacterium]